MRYEDMATDRDGVPWDLGVAVRLDAVRALADFYGPPVESALSEALDDSDAAVRRAAVEGIAALGIPAAEDRLVECVVWWSAPGDQEAAERALETMESWATEGLPEKLVDILLRPGAPALQERHSNALVRLIAADPRERLAAGAVAEQLMAFLDRADDAAARTRAEEILAWLGPAAADAMLEALIDERVSPAVVRAMAHLSDARVVEPVIRLLADPDGAMRYAAAVALKGLKDTRSVPALVTASQDADQAVRGAASDALDSMGMAAVIVGLGTLMAARNGVNAAEPRDVMETRPAPGEIGETVDEPTDFLHYGEPGA